MSNIALVSHLRSIAQLLQLDGEDFHRINAYRIAAAEIEKMTVDVSSENLGTIRGVGPSIGQVIGQFLTLGTSTKLVALTARWPIGALTMTRVHGVGPKMAMKLQKQGFANYDELLRAAKAGKIADPKLRDAVLASEGVRRIPREQALQLAKFVSSQMIPYVERVKVCGSIRRGASDSKDIDIVCMVKDDDQAKRALTAFASLGESLTSGPTRGSIRITKYAITMLCDLWVCRKESWGSHLCHVTGPKENNVRLRSMAKERGMLVSEHGIFRDGVRLGGEDEHDLYRILDIDYVEPCDRR